uniref:Peptidase S1 domain-containing protein n=1 Tax=Jaculus jaculus TaxID=51337 RepID=A0A8C5K7Y9_JACJA
MLWLLSPLLFVAIASGCGRPSFNNSSRVVNGEDAVPYSWSWQVSLQYEKDGTFRHTCGGSLIAPDWVLTAGHCISTSLTYQVVLGEYDRSVEEGPEQVIPINGEDLFVHPKWNPNCVSCGNDIALIKLSRSAQLGDHVQLACLPPAGDILPNESPCYISGWGRLYGDSGGPLNCPAGDGTWQVHGVTSFVSSLGCNTRKKPTVFTRVSAFNDWIEETMASH